MAALKNAGFSGRGLWGELSCARRDNIFLLFVDFYIEVFVL